MQIIVCLIITHVYKRVYLWKKKITANKMNECCKGLSLGWFLFLFYKIYLCAIDRHVYLLLVVAIVEMYFIVYGLLAVTDL